MAKGNSLRRRPPFREPLPRILIVCEGTSTEPAYFRETRHLERIPVELAFRPGGVPKTLVERAVALKRRANQAAKQNKDSNQNYDHIWCVFDVDEHPYLPESRQQAKDNQIEIAVSNPCFELWALLHFRDQSARIERVALHSECKKFIPGYVKKLPASKLLPLYGDALRRDQELDTWQRSRGSDGANPSTGVYRLTEQIKSHGRGRC
jgi:hypothetical protein